MQSLKMDTTMSSNVARKIAVVGSGISGAVCASTLARNGISVTIFDSARGPGGRMSQRRETTEDGKELLFDHGAPCFTVTNNPNMLGLVSEWESRGLIAEWKGKFGSFDSTAKEFVNIEQEGQSKRYVGVPGMNSLCRVLCSQPGIESKFRTGVGRMEWIEEDKLWSVMGLDGQILGRFEGVVASDKNIVSSRFTNITGQPPPLDLSPLPSLSKKVEDDIPVSPCFAVMLAFSEPLLEIPVKGLAFRNSKVLSWAHCDSSKPGRPTSSERWVLHSTREYAERVIAETGLKTKPSEATLTRIAEDVFRELEESMGGVHIPQPFFKKAHRWGSAFPCVSVGGEDECLWDKERKLAICGDFCVSPNVQGAVISGLAAASKLTASLCC